MAIANLLEAALSTSGILSPLIQELAGYGAELVEKLLSPTQQPTPLRSVTQFYLGGCIQRTGMSPQSVCWVSVAEYAPRPKAICGERVYSNSHCEGKSRQESNLEVGTMEDCCLLACPSVLAHLLSIHPGTK